MTPRPRPLVPLDTTLTRAEARRIDQLASNHYGLPTLVLMENAAQGATCSALAMLDDAGRMAPGINPGSSRAAHHVVIACGKGNNGGDGYAIARHMHNRGCMVTIVALGTPPPNSDAMINRRVVERMKLPIVSPDEGADIAQLLASASLIVDALFGTGLDRPLADAARLLVDAINGSRRPVLAVDIPSGLDADTGLPLGDPVAGAVRASRTATFVAWKRGFQNPASRSFTGEIIDVIDIGMPREVLSLVTAQGPGGVA